jgi:hypothetical protein
MVRVPTDRRRRSPDPRHNEASKSSKKTSIIAMNVRHQTGRWGMVGAFLCAWPIAALAQLQVLPANRPLEVFAGGARQIEIAFRNPGPGPVTVDLHTRLYQTTPATAVLLRTTGWKPLQVLPGQTVAEAAVLDFPAVRAETHFLIQWLDGAKTVLGKTEVVAFPTDLLAGLRTLAGEQPLGVFDPSNQLKPLLQSLAIPFQDIAEDGADKFSGKLALFGPFAVPAQVPGSLASDIRALAKRGVAVVWLQPPPVPHVPLKPSFHVVQKEGGAIVVAQCALVERLSDSPEAQLNLLRLAELALNPVAFDLPETEPQN